MALTDSDKIKIIFNRLNGKSITDTTLALDEEPFTGFPKIMFSDVWIDSIPTTNPLASHTQYATGSTNTTVQKYHKTVMTPVTTNANNKSFKVGDSFKDFIPSEYSDGSYQWELWKKDVHGNYNTQIPFGINSWNFDPVNGILTFFGNLPSGIDNVSNPPAFTAYKYIGRKGSSSLIDALLNNGIGNPDNITIRLDSNSKFTLTDKFKQASLYAQNLSSNTAETKSEYLITHTLNTRKIVVTVYEKNDAEFSIVEVPWTTVGDNQILLNFNPPVLSGNYSVLVVGSYI